MYDNFEELLNDILFAGLFKCGVDTWSKDGDRCDLFIKIKIPKDVMLFLEHYTNMLDKLDVKMSKDVLEWVFSKIVNVGAVAYGKEYVPYLLTKYKTQNLNTLLLELLNKLTLLEKGGV